MTMDRNEYDKFARMQVGIIAEHSGQPYAKVAADGKRNFWMTAPEALEYGMVNQILTKKKRCNSINMIDFCGFI